ncbi:MAG: hypothetical protein ACRDF4_03140, partial [Rhabdochlamydiaceae bacterium]
AALVVVVLILIAGLGVYLTTAFNSGTTTTTTVISTFTAQITQTNISTVTLTGSTMTEFAFPISCAKTFSNGTSGVELHLSQSAGSSVSLCVRYFSYNSNGTTIHTLVYRSTKT